MPFSAQFPQPWFSSNPQLCINEKIIAWKLQKCIFQCVSYCNMTPGPQRIELPFYSHLRFRFSFGVQWRAVRGMLPDSLLIVGPIHLHPLLVMMVPVLSWLQRARRCWLEMVSGQSVSRVLLWSLAWKVDSLLRSLSVILRYSGQYSRVESTQLW